MNINEKLAAVVEEHFQRGSSRTNLYNVQPPAGYEVMTHVLGDRYYWVCYDGRESHLYSDRWMAFGGAAEDAYECSNLGTGGEP